MKLALKLRLLMLLLLASNIAGAKTVVINPGLIVNANSLSLEGKPRFLTVKVIAGDAMGDSRLKIELELPDKQKIPSIPVFTLKRKQSIPNSLKYHNWKHLAAENYVQHNNHVFILSLPAMAGYEVADLQIGWIGATPHRYAARLTLSSAKGHKLIKHWKGSRYVEPSKP